jgi:hypothetical protein
MAYGRTFLLWRRLLERSGIGRYIGDYISFKCVNHWVWVEFCNYIQLYRCYTYKMYIPNISWYGNNSWILLRSIDLVENVQIYGSPNRTHNRPTVIQHCALSLRVAILRNNNINRISWFLFHFNISRCRNWNESFQNDFSSNVCIKNPFWWIFLCYLHYLHYFIIFRFCYLNTIDHTIYGKYRGNTNHYIAILYI